MAISRKTIEELTFTTKKGKYYVGEEVDAALDHIADEVDALQTALARANEQIAVQNQAQQEASDTDRYIREKIDSALAGFSAEILLKKDELQALEAEIAELRIEKQRIAAQLREEIVRSIARQTELLQCLDADPESCDPQKLAVPIPMPDAQEIADMDIWD